jgi:predicted CXXCH cytochrome family protein
MTLEKLVGGLVLAALTIVAPTSKAHAFHSGGVAECNGCHTMHGSYEGKQVTARTTTDASKTSVELAVPAELHPGCTS